jgi:hypothetical protein
MKRFAMVSQPLVGVIGLVMVILGILFWTGNALTLVPVHMVIGLLLVLLLWALAVMGAMVGANPIHVAVAVLWGFLMPAFGIVQHGILPGDAHWVIRLLHLLVGLAAIAIAGSLATRIRAR